MEKDYRVALQCVFVAVGATTMMLTGANQVQQNISGERFSSVAEHATNTFGFISGTTTVLAGYFGIKEVRSELDR